MTFMSKRCQPQTEVSLDKRVFVVAAWEFQRFFKWKSELFTMLLMAGLGAAVYGAGDMIQSLMRDDPAQIAVVRTGDNEVVVASLLVLENERLEFEVHSPTSIPELTARVARRELDGLLQLDEDGFRVQVFEYEDWVGRLKRHLGNVQRDERLQAHQLSSTDFQTIMAPVELTVDYHPDGSPPGAAGERVVAVIVLVLMAVGVMTGFGLFFASITGEKQQRVTEQVVSAASSQLWIDGKLIGITAMGAKNMVITGLMAFLAFSLVRQLNDSPPISTSLAGDPLTLVSIVLFGVGGLIFWNCFLAAIAATVADPNTSARTPIMFIPVLPIAIGVSGISQPDSLGMQILSWFPPTSTGVMPMRLAAGHVDTWEIAVSLVLLALGVLLLRKVASKIFELSMLIYGKEPTWREMYRWFRET